jgi:hypothetical protein
MGDLGVMANRNILNASAGVVTSTALLLEGHFTRWAVAVLCWDKFEKMRIKWYK